MEETFRGAVSALKIARVEYDAGMFAPTSTATTLYNALNALCLAVAEKDPELADMYDQALGEGEEDPDVPVPPQTRQIEMYVGEPVSEASGSWYTTYVDIPLDTPDDQIDAVAMQAFTRELEKETDIVSFFGVYNIPSLDE